MAEQRARVLRAALAESLVVLFDFGNPGVCADRRLREPVQVGVKHSGIGVALDRSRVIDKARIKTKDVVVLLQRLVDGKGEAVFDEVVTRAARAARVYEQRAERVTVGREMTNKRKRNR